MNGERQLGDVVGVVTCQRRREIVAQAEVNQVIFAQIRPGEVQLLAALEHFVDHLLVLAALAAGEQLDAFERGCLDAGEAVALVAVEYGGGDGVAQLHLTREQVAHATRW